MSRTQGPVDAAPSSTDGGSAVVGREYLRVSVDRSGRQKSTDEQHADNVRAADRRGVTLARDWYIDPGVSASRYATRSRDDFLRLMRDLEDGRFGADELWLWESSRGSRRVGEWVELIELCERTGVLIYVTTHDRSYDPGKPRDRRSLLEDAVDSEYESAKLSVRAKRASAASAAEGRPNGRVPYGYQRVYDQRTGKQMRQVPEPAEALVITELYDRLRKGFSLRSICKDFETRGVRTRFGGRFSEQVLREMALNPAYAGWRVHSSGQKSRSRRLEDGPRYEAQWPGLVDRSVWLEVYRRLTAPERRTSRPGRGKHLLSMIARCGVCDGPLAASYRRYGRGDGAPARTYQCHRASHVRVLADRLDAYAEGAIQGWLSRGDVYAELTSHPGPDTRVEQLRHELTEARLELDQLRTAAAERRISMDTLLSVEPTLVERIGALEARETELTVPSALQPFLDPGVDVAEAWNEAPLSARRELARILLCPDVLGGLYLLKPPAKGRLRNQFNGPLPVAYRAQWQGRTFTHGPEPVPDGCEVDGCERPYYGRGKCKMHHQRQWKRDAAARRAVEGSG